jgi:hypothetical protein
VSEGEALLRRALAHASGSDEAANIAKDMIMRTLLFALLLCTLASSLLADGPADNNPETVRRLPKPGVEVPAEQREQLEGGLTKLKESIDLLAERAKKDAKTRELLPDVQIYYKSVHDALKYNEFLDIKELPEAVKQLALGQQRAEQLLRGEAPWATQSGLVVRGYVSKIDGSIQPYGLIVPETYTDKTPVGYRCDIWLHGRGETMTELNFIRDRSGNPGTFTPPRTIVLHPYGRWNNAFKLAGEVDILEALESVQKRYAIDEDRIAMRGFSMGGAGAWHMTVHYPDLWFASNPGAGFSETPEFLKQFQGETLKPTWYEQKLWQLYDCPAWVANLSACPTVAYSGEKDSQKQAADRMERELKTIGRELTHIIGQNTAHSYHPAAKLEVEARLKALAVRGRDRVPADIHFQTKTLRYNRSHWVTVDEIETHWKDANVVAHIGEGFSGITVKTSGVTGFTLRFGPGEWKGVYTGGFNPLVEIDQQFGEEIGKFPKSTDKSLVMSFHKVDGKWKSGPRKSEGVVKKHGLQGPIDDAFMESFVMVRPTSKAAHEAVEKWSLSECDRAIEQWRRHFRGEARVKNDTDITDDDIQNHNLVLWGDPSSNAVLAKVIDKLPIGWGKDKITVEHYGDYPAAGHALIAIYPNPLNPEKYIVLNSGFTFRDYTHLNNARQIPVLPDWAVVDLSVPPGNVWPGKIAAADFFDEKWGVKQSEEAMTK